MTSISSFMRSAGGRAAAQNPSETANQRDSWLRQMEFAQVADMNRAGAHAPAATSARPSVQPLQSVLPTAARPVPHASDHPAQSQGNDTARAARAATASIGNSATATSSVPDEGSAATPTAASTAGPSAAAQPFEKAIAATTAALTRQLRLAFGSATQTRSEGASPEEAVHGETAAGEAPEWEERKIHFSGQGQEVDVWIRDSALTASASTPLLAQLAQEMAGMGLRMKNVTINGKAVHTERKAPPAQPEHSIHQPEKTHGTR